MPVEPQTNIERNPLVSAETLRVRCPHCRKLYLVQASDIQESKPRFECVECHHRFWIGLGGSSGFGEIEGFPLNLRDLKSKIIEPATEPCPKCSKLNPRGEAECGHCGVLIERFRHLESITQDLPDHSSQLSKLWQRVVAAYDEPIHHQTFIEAAQTENNLTYAAALYKQMAKLMPTDLVTAKRLGQVSALAESIFMPESQKMPRERRGRKSRLWHIPLFLAAVLIAVGFYTPAFRNMAGVGAAFFFLAFALRPR
ncbi:MAG: hypothetical protein AB7F86_14485 [Bdellovibrionales bacterium]